MSTTATRMRGADAIRLRRMHAPTHPAGSRRASRCSPRPALAANGITPISPKAGDTVPAGERPTFKMRVRGRHTGVFVHVCRSKRKDADGMICHDELDRQGEEEARRALRVKADFFDFPEFWLNNPGTYYWQAHRISCDDGHGRLQARGAVVKFKVALM